MGFNYTLDFFFVLHTLINNCNPWHGDQVHKVLDYVNIVCDVCLVLGMEFFNVFTNANKLSI